MMRLQEIEDGEYEQVLQRVAAVDVAKKAGMVCTRVPHDTRPGRRRTRVWEVAATTRAILELGGWLAGEGIEKVTLEATGDRRLSVKAASGGLAGQGRAIQVNDAHL